MEGDQGETKELQESAHGAADHSITLHASLHSISSSLDVVDLHLIYPDGRLDTITWHLERSAHPRCQFRSVHVLASPPPQTNSEPLADHIS